MRLRPADRQIEYYIAQIKRGELDLQPDFQRGEVWKTPKQQLLIDTILRNWYIPPIHVIESPEDASQEVLDGQQRLRAIYNFHEGEFPVDGYTQPLDPDIEDLNGCFFGDLPSARQKRFLRFGITQYTLEDFEPSEPAELFFRLNSPTVLTPAETRNAFIGRVRSQVRSLVKTMIARGLDKSSLGFSNARMSYDDVIARFCLALEHGTLTVKLTAADLSQRYRQRKPLGKAVVEDAKLCIEDIARLTHATSSEMRFNKATLFSWLWFLHEIREVLGSDALSIAALTRDRLQKARLRERHATRRSPLDSIAELYQDRATSRVADVSSVVLRNVAIWCFALSGSLPLRRRAIRQPNKYYRNLVEQCDLLLAGDFKMDEIDSIVSALEA